MNSTFWSNTIWYILLGIATIVELVIIFVKADNRKDVLALYLTICGITFCGFEISTLMCLKGYDYFPKILASHHDDSVAGNLFSQTSVSASAVLIAVLNLRFYWYLIFVGVYGIIEEWFLHLGIYKHNWYRTWMTLGGILVIIWIAKKAKGILFHNMRRAWRYVFMFFGLCTLHLHLINWAFSAAGIRTYNANLLPNHDCSMVLLAGANHLLLGISVMILYFANIKRIWKAAGIGVLYIANYAAEHYHIFSTVNGWFFVVTSISIWGMVLNVYFVDWLYPKPQRG